MRVNQTTRLTPLVMEVKAWLDDRRARIEVIFLPTYSLEFNPDEYLNSDLKHQVRSRPSVKSRDALESRVHSVMRRLKSKTERIRSYFRHQKITYST